MKATKQLHDIGQSLWLDNITRGILNDGTLESYVRDYSITGLTSNPSIFDKAIEQSQDYDESIRRSTKQGRSGEDLFFELAIQDLQRAADLFRPTYERTGCVDGWASLEVSPLLVHDADGTIKEAAALHERSARDNIFIKIPGTPEGAHAIEESIFGGVPINVTLLFSHEQYLVAAEAFMRGIERRIQAGLDPSVPSVASVFISRWDRAVAEKVPAALRNRLGIAVAKLAYAAYRNVLGSDRWLRLANAGARPQRLLWASTGTKDPDASDVLYVEALAAPFTINTIPDKTLEAFAEHGRVGALLPADGGDAEDVLTEFANVGSTGELWPNSFRTRAPKPSTSRGRACSRTSSGRGHDRDPHDRYGVYVANRPRRRSSRSSGDGRPLNSWATAPRKENTMTISPQEEVSPQDTAAEHVFPFPDPEVKRVSGPPQRLAEMLFASFRDGGLTGEVSFELRSHGGYARTVTGRVAYADEQAQTFLVVTSEGTARVPLRDIISVAGIGNDVNQRPYEDGDKGLGAGRVTEEHFGPASPDLGAEAPHDRSAQRE